MDSATSRLAAASCWALKRSLPGSSAPAWASAVPLSEVTPSEDNSTSNPRGAPTATLA